ncbi:MAG: TetR/AcrR family transcriptional regulator [Polyangiaceae bacterium]|nr:TetR/AcrR family transcriptional regulator [Myxococcales bacterium]MCB9587006.1 TetR/AcrR family transcriptional regulator [Polyangiaceae bacterium]
MVQPQRRDGEKRRDAILNAALRCFTRTGILKTSLEDIRAASGSSQSSLYHHFGGLQGIAHALLQRSFEHMFTDLRAALEGVSTARAAVHALTHAYLSWVFQNREEATFVYQMTSLEMPEDQREPFLAFKAELYAPIVERLSPFILKGELPNLPPQLYDVIVLGPAHEAGRRWTGDAPYLEQAWLLQHVPEVAWNTVKYLRRQCDSAPGTPPQTPGK